MKPVAAAAFLLLGTLPLSAQEAPATPGPEKARRLFSKAVNRLASLEAYAFSGKITLPGASKGGAAPPFPAPFFLGRNLPTGKEVEGRARADGLVSFTLDGTLQGAMKGGFILYREGKGSWRLRFGTGWKGRPLWWIPDPTRLLKELLVSHPKVEIVRNETLDQRPMRVLRLVPSKKATEDLFFSRLLPDPTRAPFFGNKGGLVFLVGGTLGKRVPKDLRYQILLWVEPGRAAIRRLLVKATASSQGLMGGRVRIQVRGGNPLPQAKSKGKNACRVDLQVDFKDTGKVPPPDLPPSVLKRLGLPLPPPPPSKEKKP